MLSGTTNAQLKEEYACGPKDQMRAAIFIAAF